MRFVLLLIAFMTSLIAHDVEYQITRGEHVMVTLYYSDKTPFSYETYELFSPENPSVPYQTGVSSANGEILFDAKAKGEWHLNVFSADGHGVKLTIQGGLKSSNASTKASLMLWQKLLLGLMAIFALYGLYSLIQTLKKINQRTPHV